MGLIIQVSGKPRAKFYWNSLEVLPERLGRIMPLPLNIY